MYEIHKLFSSSNLSKNLTAKEKKNQIFGDPKGRKLERKMGFVRLGNLQRVGTNVRWKGIKRGRWGCKIAKGKWRGKKKREKVKKEREIDI